MNASKKICIAYLGNPFHDTRITNLTDSLKAENCTVKIIGFDWITPGFQKYRDEEIVVAKLTKSFSSVLFYLKFKIVILFELFKTSADIYFAEDIYTLPFVKFRSLFNKSKVYYNSRELYAFLGGLRNRKFIQRILTAIETFYIKRVDLVLTTGEMDSDFLENFYGIKNTLVIRNIPKLQKPSSKVNLRSQLGIDPASKILLYQGVLLDGRGIELLLNELEDIEQAVLAVLGDGEKKIKWESIVEARGLKNRVYFLGSIPQKELINYTAAGDVGICLIENISISYYHALPNKLFEYIMAGLPVISSELPQLVKIINQYKVGKSINIESDERIAGRMNEFLSDNSKLEQYRSNCEKAAKELNWEVEFERVRTKLIG